MSPGEPSKRIHFIDYYWDEFTPRLQHWDCEKVKDYNIFELNIKVTHERECVGKVRDGEHIPCPDAVIVKDFEICEKCASPRIPSLSCIFEPQCTGERHESSFCRLPHVVYIAFFRSHAKVGMTAQHRIPNRLMEQGADAYCIAAKLPNRYKARDTEKLIGKELCVPQKYGAGKVLNAWAMPKEKFGIHDKYRAIRKELKEIGFDAPALNFLEYYPLPEPLRKAPKLRPTVTLHTGKVMGVKGKYLIYEMNGLHALDLSKLPSRFAYI